MHERDFGQEPQGPERSRHEPRQIEARDILHDPPPERELLAAAIDDPHAKDDVAQRARVRSPRPRQTRRHRAPERRTCAETGRLARKHLARGLQCLPDIGKPGAGARGDHEFRRIVIHDARIGACVEHVADARLAIEVLGPAAPDGRSEYPGG